MSYLLLFDIDQTLLDTAGAGRRAMQQVAAELFGAALSFDGVSFSGKLDPVIFTEAATRCGLDDIAGGEQRFRQRYVRELALELQRGEANVRALPGVLDLLEALGDGQARAVDGARRVLGLLTGNYAAAVPLKLRAVDIEPEWFAITAFGDEAPTRPDLVRLAMERFARQCGPVDPQRVIVIGDTPKDVHCAKENGCVAFAVATGEFTADQLRQSGADVAVNDLRDPAPLFELLGPSGLGGAEPPA